MKEFKNRTARNFVESKGSSEGFKPRRTFSGTKGSANSLNGSTRPFKTPFGESSVKNKLEKNLEGSTENSELEQGSFNHRTSRRISMRRNFGERDFGRPNRNFERIREGFSRKERDAGFYNSNDEKGVLEEGKESQLYEKRRENFGPRSYERRDSQRSFGPRIYDRRDNSSRSTYDRRGSEQNSESKADEDRENPRQKTNERREGSRTYRGSRQSFGQRRSFSRSSENSFPRRDRRSEDSRGRYSSGSNFSDRTFNENNSSNDESSLNNFAASHTRKRVRVGRGPGSGLGKTAGRGMKGQKSRSGGMKANFEGGQTPYFRTVPKVGAGKGINNKRKKVFKINAVSLNNSGDLKNDIREKKIPHYARRVRVFGKGTNKTFNLKRDNKSSKILDLD